MEMLSYAVSPKPVEFTRGNQFLSLHQVLLPFLKMEEEEGEGMSDFFYFPIEQQKRLH